jgi:transglutaminase-like putative cysteine protease
LLLLAAIARADESDVVVHEYVPDLASDEGTMLVSSGGTTPDAIVYRGELLSQPEGGELREGEQPMEALPGDGQAVEEAGRRSPSFHPDRVTSLDGNIGYYEVFTPMISPFKRVTAYDAVTLAPDGATPILTLSGATRSRVEPTGAEAPAPDDRPRDRFWGNVVLDFSQGDTVPLPSVSPESRVLTISSEPEVLLRIDKDAADNFYVTNLGREREVRVIFLMDAPRSYFGGSLPSARLRELPPIAALPPNVQRDAETFASELGLSRSDDFADAVRTLAAHLRSFEESDDPPRDTGNIYLDLARGRRGICRHRAYVFVVTARALGIDARFVQNEAHAWVELELPGDRGWLRVDLGGAATGLETRGDQNRPPYVPDVEDPFPRPEAYERAYEEAQRMSMQRDAERRGEGEGVGEGQGAGEGAGEPSDAVAPSPAPQGSRSRGPLTLSLDQRSFEVFRGRELEVTGTARGEGDTSGLRVEVLLRALRTDREVLLGVTVTREGGRFRGVFGVPQAQAVGEHRLVVRTPGDRRFAPAQAL